ncbi:MAG: class I SAM-dependent methyltransferase [Gammaproteobacteria bacterium]
MAFLPLDTCLACAGADIEKYLDLGKTPLANSYHDGGADLPRYPLGLSVCRQCWHNQLTVAVTPSEMFSHYAYVSGTSPRLREYFRDFARQTTAQTGSAGRVLDIGCNDGSQLNAFAELGWHTFGVDAAQNLAERCAEHKIITGFFGVDAARRLRDTFGTETMDVLTAQNVFAHTAKIDDFLAGCRMLMSPRSRLLIQTSQAMMFENNEFDTIYHEHISFFSVSSMAACAKRAGLLLTDVRIADIHGGSYVFTLMPDAPGAPQPSQAVADRLLAEKPRRERGFYARYAGGVGRTIADFDKATNALRLEGRKLIGLGAAAKGISFINVAGCRPDYIVDNNPLKCGLLSPGGNVAIVAPDKLRDEKSPVAFIALAWNLLDEMLGQINAIAPQLDYAVLRYFPRVVADKPARKLS